MRDKVTRPCPQTTTFEEKGEPKRYRTEVLPLTSLTPYHSAKPAHRPKGRWFVPNMSALHLRTSSPTSSSSSVILPQSSGVVSKSRWPSCPPPSAPRSLPVPSPSLIVLTVSACGRKATLNFNRGIKTGAYSEQLY